MGLTMQIYDSKLKAMRDMTEEEEYIAEHLPDPEQVITPEETVRILTGETE